MDKQARLAFIYSQIAMLNAELAAMQAANQYRERRGESQVYGEEAFNQLLGQYCCLEHNKVIEYLRD